MVAGHLKSFNADSEAPNPAFKRDAAKARQLLNFTLAYI